MASATYWAVVYDDVFTTYACAIYNSVEMVGTLLVVKIGNNYSTSVSIYSGIGGSIFSMITIPLCYFIPNFLARYIITFIPISVASICSGILMASLNSCSSRINHKMTSSVMIGIGVAGIIN